MCCWRERQTFLSPASAAHLVVLAMSVHHPVLAVGADLQLEVGNVVGLLCLLGDGALRGDACQDFEELEVDLRGEPVPVRGRLA